MKMGLQGKGRARVNTKRKPGGIAVQKEKQIPRLCKGKFLQCQRKKKGGGLPKTVKSEKGRREESRGEKGQRGSVRKYTKTGQNTPYLPGWHPSVRTRKPQKEDGNNTRKE